MIKINLERETYVHTLSDAFIDKVKQALMEIAGSADKVKYLEAPLLLEFPDDREMRDFARKNIFVIAMLICEKHEAIWIRRSLSHGLQIFVDE